MVTPGNMGPVAQTILRLFNMTTAGSKVIHCTIHDYHLEGKEQGSTHGEFKRRHCDSCPDRKPRPNGWKCTEKEWGIIKARHRDFVWRITGTANGFRFSDKD